MCNILSPNSHNIISSVINLLLLTVFIFTFRLNLGVLKKFIVSSAGMLCVLLYEFEVKFNVLCPVAGGESSGFLLLHVPGVPRSEGGVS